MRYILFSLFVVLQMQAQEVLFEGHVYDHKTKEPIPYVNLSFLNTLKGTSTDEQGHFFVDIPTHFLERKVHISSLGYNDTIVDAKSIYESKQFQMLEESFELDEVVVTESFGNSDVLNPISSYSLTSGFSSSSTPWVLALYFPNIGAQKKYVDRVTVFLKKNQNFKRESAKFRIRIYDVDEVTKKPNGDLLRKSIVLEHNVEKDYVSIDLAAFNIEVPQAGIYIGLEWLFVPSNWYMQKEIDQLTNKKVVEDRFAPTFRGIYTQNQNYKVMIYGMGDWTDFQVRDRNNTKNFIPAVSLKLKKE
ncbi:carboxypeptidase-like regulatory domain-containing protein [Maribacter sp. 2308TA10-17]|uniref:carboxypeptidase-like regulatory domain-containing protein n=1 Tax=Maribacter sp. 2308TA10-17 TaxID=3386276 RepID=UPI0039BCEDE3